MNQGTKAWGLALSSFFFTVAALAGAPPDAEQAAIRAMGGCYEVHFRFTETFVADPAYPVRSPDHVSGGVEWVEVDGDGPGLISLQHILVQGDTGLKHWRQDWQWEPAAQYDFKGNSTWESRPLSPSESTGAWLQKVAQVDDSPRYQCTAAWNMRGAQPNWECQAWSPLPRREFTIRNDYNVLDRRNRHWIQADGSWLHEQDNRKLIVNADGVREIAQEKGMDSYVRVPDERCASATAWWAANRDAWHAVQGVWAHVYEHHPRLQIRGRTNGALLWERLFEITDSFVASGLTDWEALAGQAHSVIHDYVVHE
jgi:hypothetical protein